MKKRLLVLLLAGMMLITAAGCSTKESQHSSSALSESNAEESAQKDASDSDSSEDSAAKITSPDSTTIVYSNDNVDLAEYKGMTAEQKVYSVSENEIQARIKEHLSEYAEYKTVTRAIKNNDYVSITFTGTSDGEVVTDNSSDAVEIQIGGMEYGEEFDQKLIGAKTGDSLDFTIKYAEDDDSTSFAGMTVKYHVEIDEVSKEVLPDYTDDFVTENLGYNTKKEYEKSIKKELQDEYTETSDSDLREALIAQVIKTSKVKSYSESLYQSYYDSVAENYSNLAEMFGTTVDDLYDQFGMSEEDLKQEALDYLYRYLIVNAIAENEKISVSDSEYKTKCKEYAKENEYSSTKEFVKDYGKSNIKNMILEEKILDLLVKDTKITEVPSVYPEE